MQYWDPLSFATREGIRARGILRGATVLLVEDMDLPRRFYGKSLRGSARVLEAASVEEGLRIGHSALPDLDVVVTDLALPDGLGWEVIIELHARDPMLRFLVVSGIQETGPPEDLPAALLERILFVDKPTSGHELLAVAAYARHLVQQERAGAGGSAGSGSKRMSADSGAPKKPQIERCPRHDDLSRHESQAVRGCIMGLSNQEIADQLGLSITAAKKHVRAGLTKLRVSSRHHATGAIQRDRGRGKCQ